MKCKIISCYFGKLPNWIQLWLKSCENNPSFDFLIVTDDKRKMRLPKNVTIHYTTLSELKENFQKNFEFEILLDTPYKLCDYKPIYHLVFKEQLIGYDYWGHCDLDMVFGDLKSFLFPAMEKGYEKIGSYGHLTLYKNEDSKKEIYKLSGSPFNYRTIYTSPKSFGFDEMRGINLIALNNSIKWYQIGHDKIADKYNLHDKGKILFHHRENYDNQKLVYYNKKIFQIYNHNGETKIVELMYYHFSKTKLHLNDISDYNEIIFFEDLVEKLDYKGLIYEFESKAKKDKSSYIMQINHGNFRAEKIKTFLKRNLIDQWIYLKFRLFQIKWKRKIII